MHKKKKDLIVFLFYLELKKLDRSGTWDPCGNLEILFKEIDLDDPTPLIDEVYWDARKEKQELLIQLTAREADEKNQTKDKYSLEKVTAWSYDMKSHAEKCFERCCEVAWKDVSTLQAGGNAMH